MSLTESLVATLEGFSRAKFSTWIHYPPDRLLLDAGEGVATAMGNYIYGIEQILLSHGHYDHIGGIPGIIRSRLSSRGDREKPLEIHYPAGCKPVDELRRYLDSSVEFRSFEVTWRPAEEGTEVPLRGEGVPRTALAFRTRHIRRQLTLGWAVVEPRRRLRKEFAHLAQEELATLARERRASLAARHPELDRRALGERARKEQEETLMEPYRKRLLVYSGDALPLAPEDAEGAAVLVHDCTFLRVKDRDRDTHAALPEVLDLAEAARVEGLVLFHVSTRYRTREIRAALEEARASRGRELPVWMLENRMGRRTSPAPLA